MQITNLLIFLLFHKTKQKRVIKIVWEEIKRKFKEIKLGHYLKELKFKNVKMNGKKYEINLFDQGYT